MDQQTDPHSFERGLVEKSIEKLKSQLEEFHEMLVDASVATSGELNNKIRETLKKLAAMEARLREIQPVSQETSWYAPLKPENPPIAGSSQQGSKNNLAGLVRQYIGQGKTEEALALARRDIWRFDPSLTDDVVLLGSSYQNNENNYSVTGRISLDAYKQELARINYALLNILKKLPEIVSEKLESAPTIPPKTEKKESDPITEPEMVFVEGGAFRMGSNDGPKNEKPIHRVVLDDFYIGKYAVTVAQFAAFIKDDHYVTTAERDGSSYVYNIKNWEDKKGVCWEHDVKGAKRPTSAYTHPVIHVSWDDAKAYCDWLSGKTGKKYCLPTEAEWEYAARGGRQSNGFIYSGSDAIDDVAWYSENSGNTTRAAGMTKSGKELGIFDMSGNVWEWCADWYDGKYYANNDSFQNPQGPKTGTSRALRGGSWSHLPSYCRVANRFNFVPTNRYCSIGFRVVFPQ